MLLRSLDSGRLHSMVELIDAGRYMLDEVASGLGQPDPSCVALEQEEAKVFLQRPDPCADARLTNAERIGGMTEAQIFGRRRASG